MKFNKSLVFLSAVMFFTQLSAKDLAKEKEMICTARSGFAVNLFVAMQDKDNYVNELQGAILPQMYKGWKEKAKNKYIGKLKVSQNTFDGAYDRVWDEESNNLNSYLVAKNLPDNPSEIRATGLKYFMNKLEELGCQKNY